VQEVSIDEIINYKILPYNIYSELGEKIFNAGEVLTPGKLIQLRNSSGLYKEETIKTKTPKKELQAKPETRTFQIEKTEELDKHIHVTQKLEKSLEIKVLPERLTLNSIDTSDYDGPVNKIAKINPDMQIKLTVFYNKMIEMIAQKAPIKDISNMVTILQNSITDGILFEQKDIYFCSQLKLLGGYNKCHSLNTAILSGALAKKMNMNEGNISDIVFAGLLHDIGKIRIPQELLDKKNFTHEEQKIKESHTKIGYKIIKEEMDFPEKIARVALEHHENNDGSGYPQGKSGDLISKFSKIVNVCNYFDNVSSNRTGQTVKNIKDAMHIILEAGSKRFAAEELYTFVHMFNYNDTISFEEMEL
jgi:putative nucleotidyltransferase with HDIG domain